MADTTLRSRLAGPPILVAPGVYDPLTAHLAERAGVLVIGDGGSAVGALPPLAAFSILAVLRQLVVFAGHGLFPLMFQLDLFITYSLAGVNT